MERDARSYLTILLHAHLPFVREPDHERFLEEGWFYEALHECYLPLLMSFESLIREGVDFRVSVSLTPTLLSMFDDELLRSRFELKLNSLIELSEKESERLSSDAQFYETARFYRDRFVAQREFYLQRCGGDVTGAFRRLQDAGYIEILTSAATHGYLPILRHEPSAVRAQIRVAVDHYAERFGRPPEGIWLPECGYYPGLDEELAAAGLRYFIVESHGVLHGSNRPAYGVYAPTICRSGVVAFARDPECAQQVWSVKEGFPGAPDYREFYRDIGHDLPLGYINDYIGVNGLRTDTGLKYYRVTGATDQKQPYVREQAMQQAVQHAALFLQWRQKQTEWLAPQMDRRPIIVAPYDAELFGHWWFEGPEWLSCLLRKIALDQDTLITATPSEYLADRDDSQTSTPVASSWGAGGYSQVWISHENDWIVPELLRTAHAMRRLAGAYPSPSAVECRALKQAAREALLAQASDWAFMIKNNTNAEFATERVKQHLSQFDEIAAMLDSGDLEDVTTGGDSELLRRLETLEKENNLFRDINVKVFAERIERPSESIQHAPRHVAFITAEAQPYVKVGGLADVAGALPPALARTGAEVTLILPAYRGIDWQKHGIEPLAGALFVDVGGVRTEFGLLEAASPAPGVRVILVARDEYFDRDGVYVDPTTGDEYTDSAERFVFFTRAAIEALRFLGRPVDVVHSHDHQTALASAYLKTHYAEDPVVGEAASVYTLHNLGYQGVHAPDILDFAHFGRDRFHPGSPFEHNGKVNFMKVGICFADKVNTVSRNYAYEICSDESLGAGLGEVLRSRGEDFGGILNGIDVDEWNPAADPFLPSAYDANDVSGKRAAKARLLEIAGISASHIDAPLVGMITRLVDQKGLDLVHDAVRRMLSQGITLVVLGTGLRKYEDFFHETASRYRGRVAALIKFDNGLAHLIEAGSDIFLMPSLYEPCGLNQMYSLRYGTVPVVRATGGLADTVSDDDAQPGVGVGFSFTEYTPEALLDALQRTLRAYRDPERWGSIRHRGMTQDHSWGASALDYYNLYRSAMRDLSLTLDHSSS